MLLYRTAAGEKLVKARRRHKTKRRRTMSRYAPDGKYILLRHASPEQLASVWRGKLDVRQVWWCVRCHRVSRAGDLHMFVYDDRPNEGDNCCPYCHGAPLYWWHGWPSLVLERWTANPEPGTSYHFAQDWLEPETEEPGIIQPPTAELALER